VKTRFKESFTKDLRGIRDKGLLARIQRVVQSVEQAETLDQVPHLRKLQGGDRYYRVRIGDYRVGLALEGDVVVFVRALHRREVYRYFP
jgi:mRNA interferase RelE/StbE